MTKPYRTVSPEVLVASSDVVIVDSADIALLKQLASASPKRRARICAHQDHQQTLHEMLIVLQRDVYIQPHRHHGKAESLHIIEGQVDFVIFDSDGIVARVERLGAASDGLCPYLRMSAPIYHTLLVRSEFLVFHETTVGPLRAEQTEYASWAPEESRIAERSAFIRQLEDKVVSFKQGS